MTKPKSKEVISETARLALKESGGLQTGILIAIVVLSALERDLPLFILVTSFIYSFFLLKAQVGLLKEQLDEKETK